ncbi:anti-sigma factor antagonist [Streptomyces sp. RKND-216]|uniref:STAS domain-containing protein n=1 Tax=Streptomyces sp. RKND-216 TaxID=2562581 RepID=UPI00109DA85F|nr:STAS domain-containing protein [Streptomyces sp. RKND-216]THA24404.1 anti-sigma factor antagonist [Streptomyces sp. RKND-216]
MSPPHHRTRDKAPGTAEHATPAEHTTASGQECASREAHLAVDRDVTGDVLTIRVGGAIDADTSPDLEAALTSAADPVVRRTVLDLSRVDFADSSALHTLLTAQREHRAAGRQMVLAGPFSASLHRLFTITGTDAFFTLMDAPSFPRSDTPDGSGRHGGEWSDGAHTAREEEARTWKT